MAQRLPAALDHLPRATPLRPIAWLGATALCLVGSASSAHTPTPAEPPSPDRYAASELPALNIYEPMYFIVGRDGDTTARFQFSFSYRLLDEHSAIAQAWPSALQLHLGYTQTSLWNLSEDSAPFYDTSYRPSLYWQSGSLREGVVPGLLRAGFEHESNGQEGLASRSIDTLFVQPAWYVSIGDRELIALPKLVIYIEKSDNPDIREYRGWGDLALRYGRENGWIVTSVLRAGHAGYGSLQLDISYPIRAPIFARAGGFVYAQLFHGYGETLIDYDQKEDLQVRIGVAIVR